MLELRAMGRSAGCSLLDPVAGAPVSRLGGAVIAAVLALACSSSSSATNPGAGGTGSGGGGQPGTGGNGGGAGGGASAVATRSCNAINIVLASQIDSYRDCASALSLDVSASDITDLQGLENLKRVDGSIVIRSPSIRTLDGLWGLREVGDQRSATGVAYSLFISSNPQLTSLTPLFGITSFTGDSVRIADNPALTPCTAEAAVSYLRDQAGFSGSAVVTGNSTCGSASGSGGASGIDRTSTACNDCLTACAGLPSCCTGTGCTCSSECAVTGCSSGYTLCCGPDGSCICTADCPY